MSTDSIDKNLEADRLVKELRAYEQQLAPHVKDCEAGKIIVEAAKALAQAVETLQSLHAVATDLSVIATKHCPKDHHDWPRVCELAGRL
jgi:hypothetical protein